MKLKKYIELNAPFTSKEKVDGLLHSLNARNTMLTKELKNKLYCLCNEENLPYLKEQLSIYVEEYKYRPSKPKPKGMTKEEIIAANKARVAKYHPEPDLTTCSTTVYKNRRKIEFEKKMKERAMKLWYSIVSVPMGGMKKR